MPSWCDKLGSTPTVGLRLDPQFLTTEALLSTFQPLLNKMHSKGKPEFNLDNTTKFSMSFSTIDGFQYSADPTRLAVAFKHSLKALIGDDGLPITELTSIAKPFSELLPMATERLVDAAFTLAHGHRRMIERIGVVSTTLLKPSEAPPGIGSFINYIGRPWADDTPYYTISIVSDLEQSHLFKDRCSHTISRPEDQEQDLLTLVFDYQRLFAKPRTLSRSIINKSIKEVETSALAYFEQIGIGALFDEEIIHRRARNGRESSERVRGSGGLQGTGSPETRPETRS